MTRHRRLYFAALILLATLAPPARATTLTVNQDGTTSYAAIQSAIDAAIHGDEIIVHPGTYVEHINFNSKNIILRSLDPNDGGIVSSTIIDGNFQGPVARFSGDEEATCVLAGFTLTHGVGDCGFSMLCRGPPVGGYCEVFYYSYGGAIYGGDLPGSGVTIERNIFIDNRARGSINCPNSSPAALSAHTTDYNIIAWHYDGYGGAIYNCNGLIQHNTFMNNYAQTNGGALYKCHGLIKNNIFRENSAYSGGGALASCPGTVENNIFAENSAFLGGGLVGSAGTVRNNIFYANNASAIGGGICFYSDSRPDTQVSNCIFWGNTAPESSQINERTTPSYSCIQDWTQGGEGNTNENPLFVDPENGNFRLRAGSPCIDTGMRIAEMAEDFVGNPRGFDGDGLGAGATGDGSDFDIGAYEYIEGQARLVLAYSDVTEQRYPHGRPAGYSSRGSAHVLGGGDYEQRMQEGGVWFELHSLDVAGPAHALLVIAYDDRTGVAFPYGQPAGYVNRGAFHVDAGADYAGNLIAGGWLALFQRADDPQPILPVIAYVDATGAFYPYGRPPGYVQRGSLHVEAATDYQGNSVGACWLALFHPRNSPEAPPADCHATASWMLYP